MALRPDTGTSEPDTSPDRDADAPADRTSPRPLARLGAAALAGLVTLLALVAVTGLLGTPVGAADNGDGLRLYCGVGLVPDTPGQRANWQGGVVLDFTRAEPCPDPAPSAALPVLRAAVHGDDPTFSLTRLGWTYALLTAGVVAAATWAAGARRLWGALVLLPVLLPLLRADFSRFALSTYSEPAGLLGAVALVAGVGAVAVTRRSDRAARLVALVLVAGGGLLATTAKAGYAPLLLVAAGVCVLTGVQVGRQQRWWDRLAGPVVAGVVVLAAAAPLAATLDWQARFYGPVNAHNLTYTVALTEVPGSAAELGLSAAAADDAGNAFYPNGPDGVAGADVIAADPDAARSRVWTLLARNPGALARAIGVAVQATQGRSLDYLPAEPWTTASVPPVPNSSVGEQGATAAQLRGWLDGMAAPWWPSLVTVLGLAAGLAGVLARRRPGAALGRLAGVATVGALGIAALAVLGDGYFEIAKHVWLSAYLLDVTLLAVLGAVGVAAVTAWRHRTR